MQWGKEIVRLVWGFLESGFELTLIPRDQKHYHGPTIRVGAYTGQVINEIESVLGSSGSPESPGMWLPQVLDCSHGRGTQHTELPCTGSRCQPQAWSATRLG